MSAKGSSETRRGQETTGFAETLCFESGPGMSSAMFVESRRTPRLIVWSALLFAGSAFTISWWHWWTFQYGTFDLAFYVQALWLGGGGGGGGGVPSVSVRGSRQRGAVFCLFA